MAEHRIVLEHNPAEEDVLKVRRHVEEYNDQHAEPEQFKPLALFVRDPDGDVVGGLLGHTHWRWMYIEKVWVTDDLRGSGYGQQLMEQAEQEARTRGCLHAYLDTMDFQAVGFYEKMGYELLGQLEDYPPGHAKYFLYKRNLGAQK